MPKNKPTPADLIPVAAVLVLALLIWLAVLPGDAGRYVEVTVAGQGTERYPLAADRTLELDSRGVRLTVIVENGAVCVGQADCPDGVCTATGHISRTGQSIVCAPAGVVIRVVGGEQDADGIAG